MRSRGADTGPARRSAPVPGEVPWRRRRPVSAMLSGMENVVLFFHLLGVLLFAAGIALAGVAFETARRRERPAEIAILSLIHI